MKLRKEQTDVFRGRALADFEDRAIQHLRRDLSKQTLLFSDDALRIRVKDCIPRAGKYGLNTQRQVMCFVDSSFLIGKDIETNPRQAWAAEVLRSGQLSPEDKAKLLLATACSVYREQTVGG